MTISKPTSAHWSIALRTVSQSACRTCIINGFSVTQGAIVRYMRRCARPQRSRSLRLVVSKKRAKGRERLIRLQQLRRAQLRPHRQQARRLAPIIDLCRVVGVGLPVNGQAIGIAGGHAAESVVGFHVQVGQRQRHTRAAFDGGTRLRRRPAIHCENDQCDTPDRSRS